MGVDAQLYAAAAASHDQSPHIRQQSDAFTVMDKPTTVHSTTVASEAVTQNGTKSATQQEGIYIIYYFIPVVTNLN